jgi:urea carboxylase-associated protein 2
MPVLPASSWPSPPDGVDADRLVWAETVAGGGYTHKVVARGTAVRLTDLEGDACAHVLLYNADQPWERLNVADTVKVQWNAYLSTGAQLLSDQGRVLATVTASSGNHDALCGTSTLAANTARYGDGAPQSASPAGRELFALAAAKNGLSKRDVPASVSFFQGVRVEADGGLTYTGPVGGSVTFVAEIPLLVLLANVPHPLDPRPEYTCTLLEVLAWRDRPSTTADTPERLRALENTTDYLTARGLA